MPLKSKKILQSNQDVYRNYPLYLKQLKESVQLEIKNKLNIHVNSSLIVNGHQVEFFHPGILSKEIIAHKIAKNTDGTPLSIILDHDHKDINFTYPYIYYQDNEPRIKKNIFLLAKESKINHNIENSVKEGFANLLDNIKDNLSGFYQAEPQSNFQENLLILKKNLTSPGSYIDYIINSRKKSLQKKHVLTNFLKVSEIASMNGWKEFCKLITSDMKKFREVYNNALQYYRKTHHIKNHAQPVPDLHDDELPFWVANNTDTRIKAKGNDAQKNLLPRAITLSIFLRLFVSDIFIHGNGGGRYDLVTNKIIWNFFHVRPSDFIVKTATLHLPFFDTANFDKIRLIKSFREWSIMYRNFLYHPEKFPGTDINLLHERFALIEEFKTSLRYKKIIHKKLEENRLSIITAMEALRSSLLDDREQIKKYIVDKSTLIDRTFPYFFYDLSKVFMDNEYEIIQSGTSSN
jgi:hypothetical protein